MSTSGEPPAATAPAGVRGRRGPGWWVAPVYLALALMLLPWVVVLGFTLPDRAVSSNYRLAWVGFDTLLLASLARTAWLAWRRSPFVVNVASVTAALLVVDAWFDVTTSPRGRDLLLSVVTAVLVELPAAVLSMVIAARAQVQIARTGAIRRHRWRFVREAESAAGTFSQDAPDSQVPLT